MEYKEMLILVYFKSHYKKYDFREMMELMGMTYGQLQKKIDTLFKSEYLLFINDYIVLSKDGELLLNDNELSSFGFEDVKIEKRERMNINDIYIPKKFEM